MMLIFDLPSIIPSKIVSIKEEHVLYLENIYIYLHEATELWTTTPSFGQKSNKQPGFFSTLEVYIKDERSKIWPGQIVMISKTE